MIPQEDFFQFRRGRPTYNDSRKLKVLVVGGKHDGLYPGEKKLNASIWFPSGKVIENLHLEIKKDEEGNEIVILGREEDSYVDILDDEKLEDFRFYGNFTTN